MRSDIVLACSLLITACQDPDAPPPPVGGGPSGGQTVPPVGGTGPDTTDSPTTAASSTTDVLDASGDSTAGPATGGTAAGSGTGPGGPLLSGQLLDGPAGLVPDTCRIRLHTIDSLDPGSGLPLETAYEAIATVEALPQAYVVGAVPDESIVAGDMVYVSALCDVDGDGALDGLGAYYPEVPLEPVLLPAVGVDMVLDNVQ